MANPTTFRMKTAGPPPPANRDTWPSTWTPMLIKNTTHAATWNPKSPVSLLPVEGPTPGVVAR